jgi:hypothetical protein
MAIAVAAELERTAVAEDYHETHLTFSEIGKGRSRMILAKCAFGHSHSGISVMDFAGSHFEAVMSDRSKTIRCYGAMPKGI